MANPDVDEALKSLLQKLESKSGLQLSSSSINSQISPVFAAFAPSTKPSSRALAHLVISRLVSNARPQASAVASSSYQSDQEKATNDLTRLFSPIIESRLATTSLEEVVPALGLFAALFQIDSATASGIFLKDGVIDAVMDVPDLFAGQDGVAACQAVAALLSQASGVKPCRPLVQTHAASWLQDQVRRDTVDPGVRAAAANALTKLSKGMAEDVSSDSLSSLGGGAPTDTAVEDARRKDDEESLAKLMKNLIVDSKPPSRADSDLGGTSQSILDAVEGLAYSSMDSTVKESLSTDTAFLTRLFSLVPPPKKHQTGAKPTINVTSETLPPEEKASVALLYGVAVIVLNLVSFKPKLSDEEKQVDRLKRMTKEGARTGGTLADPDAKGTENTLETDDAVKKRCKRVLKAGVIPALVSMSHRKESEGIRRAVGRIFLYLVEDKENRGKIVQGGGVKALQRIIDASFTGLKDAPSAPKKPPSKFDSTVAGAASSSAKSLDAQDLPAIQALAKLSITASPLLLFGPDASSSLDAIHPFSHLLLNPSSTLLQKFESLMALTNLASLGPPIASRIATYKEPGLGTVLNKTETLLLDDNTMVRRAATELLCNLVASDTVWERYTGEKPDGTRSPPSEEGDKALVSRLRILLAMADVDDVPTRLAASGALAMLSNAPDVSRLLLSKMENGPEKVFNVLADLIAPSQTDDEPLPPPEFRAQLAHRGIACARTLLTNSPTDTSTRNNVIKAVKATDLGGAVVRALSAAENAGNQEMLVAGAEALKWMIGNGIEIVV